MTILYKDGSAVFFRHTSDVREALGYGFSTDPGGYVAPTLTSAEQVQAVALAEKDRLGSPLTTDEAALVAAYKIANGEANPNWNAMPSSPINRWY